MAKPLYGNTWQREAAIAQRGVIAATRSLRVVLAGPNSHNFSKYYRNLRREHENLEFYGVFTRISSSCERYIVLSFSFKMVLGFFHNSLLANLKWKECKQEILLSIA